MNNTFDKFKFRCHYLGDLMTGVAKNWDVENSKTCNSKLQEIHREIAWGRRKKIESKYLTKGIAGEENGLTLLSLVKRVFFKKNDQRIENDFLSGEPDAYIGTDINHAEEGYDIKCAWDFTTMPYTNDKLDSDYIYQMMAYMALTGAKRWHVAHCLVNAPASMIIQEKKRVWFKWDCPEETETPTNEFIKYKEACIDIEKNMIYDLAQFKKDNMVFDYDIPNAEWTFDIPMEQRIRIVTIERDEAMIGKIYARIMECRAWMNSNLFPITSTVEGIKETVFNDLLIKGESSVTEQDIKMTLVQQGKMKLSEVIEEKVPIKNPPPKNVPKEKKAAAQEKIKAVKKVKKVEI